MPRAVWTGAITFGLVYIPVKLYPGSAPGALDLDLLDKRDFAPVGYRRVNKRTGKEVAAENMVKGYEYRKGEYVVLTDEDFRQANVKATQAVDIQAFVAAHEIPAQYFDTPYYLEPVKRGAKAYVLLRETLRKTDRVGVANVVLRARQHLAVVLPDDRLLVLNTLRFADEIRPASGLQLPGRNLKEAGVSPKELAMAERLVDDMTEQWDPKAYKDTYRDDLLARIKERVKRGTKHEVVAPEEGAAPRRSAEVIDLMALLKKSLDTKGGRAHAPKRPQRRAAARAEGARSRRSAAVERRRRSA
jgi:DNA end-binding protein Ku